jgi:FkbM family methyltransferase
MKSIKRLIAKLIANNLSGWILRKINRDEFNVNNFSISTNSIHVTSTTCAHIFFRLYENTELKFVSKYVKDNATIVELGSSIGVITSAIAMSRSDCTFHCIEMNPDLIPLLEKNLKNNVNSDFFISNKAITGRFVEPGEKAYFKKGTDSTTGSLGEQKEGAYLIPKIRLSDYIKSNNIKEFTLVCDIEGAEVQILIEDAEALDKCQQIIIEAHFINYNRVYYTPELIKKLILSKGFKIIDEYGPNFVFERA